MKPQLEVNTNLVSSVAFRQSNCSSLHDELFILRVYQMRMCERVQQIMQGKLKREFSYCL